MTLAFCQTQIKWPHVVCIAVHLILFHSFPQMLNPVTPTRVSCLMVDEHILSDFLHSSVALKHMVLLICPDLLMYLEIHKKIDLYIQWLEYTFFFFFFLRFVKKTKENLVLLYYFLTYFNKITFFFFFLMFTNSKSVTKLGWQCNNPIQTVGQ